MGTLVVNLDRAARAEITGSTDPEGKRVTATTWVKRIKPGSAAAHPGVYCLRTILADQDNATLWAVRPKTGTYGTYGTYGAVGHRAAPTSARAGPRKDVLQPRGIGLAFA